MAKKSKWPTAVFLATRFRKISDFIVNFKTIVLNMGTAVAYFPTPKPTLAVVTTHLTDLETAEVTAKTRVVGSAAARDLKYDVSYKELNDLRLYVQGVANTASDAATAIAMIEASGFSVKVNGSRMKAPIEARNTTQQGVVALIAKASGKPSVYMWQISPDGAAWTDLPVTQVAKTSVASLTSGQKKYFRVQFMNKKDGTSEWTAAVAIVVT